MSKELPIIISKGLAGVTSKDNPDFETWRKAHEEELYYYSFDDAKRIYKNGLFVNKYGKEKFNSLSPEERDSLYESDAINTYLQDNYSEDERFEEINNLTLEGKRELINSEYKNPNELESFYNASTENVLNGTPVKPKEKEGFWDKLARYSSGISSPTIGGAYDPSTTALLQNAGAEKRIEGDQEHILGNIIEKDKDRKVESVREDSNDYLKFYTDAINNGDISQEDLNTEIEKAFRGYTTTINTPDGSAEYEIPGSRYYNVFKDSKWLEDLSEKEKLEYFSKYQALYNKYGLSDAIYYLDSELQKRIADKQNWFTATYKTAWQTTVNGVVPDMIKTVLSVPALFMDEKEAANYLQEHTKYFDDVSKYGTWKTDLINEAEANGGISQRKIVWNKDQENSWVSGKTFVDVAEQSKWMIELGLSTYLGTGAFNMITKTLNTTNKVVNTIAKGTGYIAKTMIETSPIATAEAYQVFDDTRKANYNSINTKIEDVALQNAIEQIKESEAQRSINEMANRAILEFRKSNPDVKPEDIDIEAFRKKAEQEYLYFLKEKNKEAISPLYDKERELADITSIDAFQTTYLLSAAKTAGINKVARGFLETLPINKAIKSPSSKVKTKINASGLVEEIPMSTYSKYINPILDHTLWEGVDEMADEFISAFGRGYGTTKFEQFVDPNPDYNALDRYLASILGGMVSTGKSLFEEETWKAGFLGAISGPATVNLNLRHKLDPINGKSYTFLEKVNNWVTNPILNDVIENKYIEARTKERIENVNKILQKHSNTYKGIADVVKILDAQNSSITFDNAEDALSYNHDLQVAFMMELDALSKDSMTSSSEILENTRKIIDNAAKGNISEEDINSFIANNRGTSVTKEEAKQRIQENATKLLDTKKKIEDKRKSLKGNYHFTNLNEKQQDQLISDILLVENRKERIESIKSKLGLSSNNKPSIIAGSSKHADILIDQMREEILFISHEIDRLKFAFLDDNLKDYDPKTRKARRVMLKELNKSERDLRSKREKLKSQQFDENGFSKTLSAEEIKMLDSESLEMMLNPDNSKYYSKEQQEEIGKAIEELDKTISSSDLVNDDSYTYAKTLSKLEREASIVDRMNNAYLTYGLDGQSLASLYKRRENRKERIKSDNNKKARLSSINEFVYDIEGNQTTDLEKVTLEASKYNEEDINDYIEENKDYLLDSIIEALNKGKVKRQLKNTIGESVNSINTTNDIRKIALNAVNTIIDNKDVNSVDDISSYVKSIIEDPNIDKELKDALTQILNNLEFVSENEKTKESIEAPIVTDSTSGESAEPQSSPEVNVEMTPEEKEMSTVPEPVEKTVDQFGNEIEVKENPIIELVNNIIDNIKGFTDASKEIVRKIVSNIDITSTAQEIADYLIKEAGKLDISSEDNDGFKAADLLRDCANRVLLKKDREESKSKEEKPGKTTKNVFSNINSSTLKSVDMDDVLKKYPNSPLANFYKRHKVREFLTSRRLDPASTVLFVLDPQLTEESKKSIEEQGKNYIEIDSIPLVAVVEVETKEDGVTFEINNKHYQPIAIMHDSQYSMEEATALRHIRRRAVTQEKSDNAQLLVDNDGSTVTTVIIGEANAVRAIPPKHLEKDKEPNRSAQTLQIGDLSKEEREEIINLSKKDRRKSPIYQRMKSAFLSKIKGRKTSDGKTMIVYEEPNLKEDLNNNPEIIPIEGFITKVSDTKDKNSDRLIIDLIREGDPSALKSNSRIKRYLDSLNSYLTEKFPKITGKYEKGSTEKTPTTIEELGENSDESALDSFADNLGTTLNNFLNLPTKEGWRYGIDNVKMSDDGTVQFTLFIYNASGDRINLGSLSNNPLSETEQMNILKNLFLEENGEVRTRSNKADFIIWNVPYHDADNNTQAARDNMADIYDDDIIEFSKNSLQYRISGVWLNSPYKENGEPNYQKGEIAKARYIKKRAQEENKEVSTSKDNTGAFSTENNNIYDNTIQNNSPTQVAQENTTKVGPSIVDTNTGVVIEGPNVEPEVYNKPVEQGSEDSLLDRMLKKENPNQVDTKSIPNKFKWGVFEGSVMTVEEIEEILTDAGVNKEDWEARSLEEREKVFECCGIV